MVLRQQAGLTAVPTSGAITPGLTFGRFLRFLREQEYPRISQSAVAAQLEKLTKAPYDRTVYSRVENDTGYPAFDVLYFLYVALRELRVPISAEQRQLFLRLARERLVSKMTHQERGIAPADWEQLRHNIEVYERKFPSPLLIERRAAPVRYVREASLPDVRHVVGREAWLDEMQQHLLDPLAPKLVIVHGSLGAGKSCALHALGWRLKQMHPDDPPAVSLVEFDAKAPEPAEEAILDQFLCAVLADLGAAAAIEVMKQGKTLEERITAAFEALEHVQRAIVLVDNAEMVIDADSAIAALWQQFLSSFLRCNHRLTLILATKEWPGWYGDASFVLETQLPPLSPQAGAAILCRTGFASVPEELLMRVSVALSNHPEAILWFARLARRKVFHLSYSGQGGKDLVCLDEGTDAGDIQALERALRDPHLFAGAATAMLRPLLSRVITRRLSQRAQQLLELLAVARLALLPDALEVVFEDLYELHAQLESASLLVAHQNRYQLLPLVIAAGNQRIAAPRREEVEQHLIAVYQAWVEMGIFSSEREQGQVITELALLLLSHQRLLSAAELLIHYGWLSFDLGYGVPLARRTHERMKQFDWKEGLEDEVGGLLLRAVLARYLGENLQARERKQAYQRVYELATAGRVELKARTRVHLAHHILRYLVAQDCYAEALTLIDEACARYGELRETEPISYAELLDNQAYVQGRWGDSLAAQARDFSRRGEHLAADKAKEEAMQHWGPCVEVHHQCVVLLRQCERMASLLERSHINFKLAKFLNDISYYQRCLGDLEAATKAMQGCLELKEAGYSWPNSLAVSYGNWAQLLAEAGQFRQSLAYTERSLQIVRQEIEKGDTGLGEELGMQLIDRGKILSLLCRLEEARQCFEDGIRLVEGTGRRYYADEARDGLRSIEVQLRDNPQRQLDYRWFPTYHRLVSFDAIGWLTQAAGPFSGEEQEEWDRCITAPDDDAAQKHIAALIVQSRKRELAACMEEGREPRFHYPAIPQLEVQECANELRALRQEIEEDERNCIVRRLYLEAIDERLDELERLKAVARGDDADFWMRTQRLFPKPTAHEMAVAVDELLNLVKRGLGRSESREASAALLRQLQQGHVVVRGVRVEAESEESPGAQQGESTAVPDQQGQRLFAPITVQRFFEDLFRAYGIAFEVVLDPLSTSERVDLNLHKLFLPAEKWMSLARIREILAHEVEIHIVRSSNGASSPLALLGSGTRGYLEAEEGLATYYSLEAARYGAPAQSKLWIGTLLAGLATGVTCPPLGFRALYRLLTAVKLLTDLLAGKQGDAERLLQDAQRYAQNRCLRTFRGVSNLALSGICSTKDVLYQRGYASVSSSLEADPGRFARLMVGSVGLDQLDDLAELGIVNPPTPHRRLAADPHLERYVVQYAEDGDAERGASRARIGQ